MKHAYLASFACALLAVSCVTRGPHPSPTAAGEKTPGTAARAIVPLISVPLLLSETVTFADRVVERVIDYEYAGDSLDFSAKVSRKPSQPDPVERVVRVYENCRLSNQKTRDSLGQLASESAYEYGQDASLGEGLTKTLVDASGTSRETIAYRYKIVTVLQGSRN